MELNARARKLTEKYDLDPQDVLYCDAVHAGWSKVDAAYYAYNLAYPEPTKINVWLKEHQKIRPGITKLLNDFESEDIENRRKMKDLERKASARQAKAEAEAAKSQATTEESLRTKQGMLEYLISLAATPNLDLKTKADIAKQITDLQQYKKEDTVEIDNRIFFHLSSNCKYCNRCENCDVKKWCEERGAVVKHPLGNPLVWTVKDNEEQ